MSKRAIASNAKTRIYEVIHDDKHRSILKESTDQYLLDIEAAMLRYLGSYVRVPEVIAIEKGRLELEYIPNHGSCDDGCEREIAEVLAGLHQTNTSQYGLEFDTTIGPFRQRNTWHERWIDFYREERVLDFSIKAYDEGAIDRILSKRIERFAVDFEKYLLEPKNPSLLHGDVWAGNVLTYDGHLSALIDPAIYYGHHEMELAFIGMFNTFGPAFYRRYDEVITIEEGFFEQRAYIYRLFPYLVHVRAFGNSYLHGIDSILKRFGY